MIVKDWRLTIIKEPAQVFVDLLVELALIRKRSIHLKTPQYPLDPTEVMNIMFMKNISGNMIAGMPSYHLMSLCLLSYKCIKPVLMARTQNG
jgi:Na+-transporting NADH:ubiquinone oxidoreductase subunit NqrA